MEEAVGTFFLSKTHAQSLVYMLNEIRVDENKTAYRAVLHGRNNAGVRTVSQVEWETWVNTFAAFTKCRGKYEIQRACVDWLRATGERTDYAKALIERMYFDVVMRENTLPFMKKHLYKCIKQGGVDGL